MSSPTRLNTSPPHGHFVTINIQDLLGRQEPTQNSVPIINTNSGNSSTKTSSKNRQVKTETKAESKLKKLPEKVAKVAASLHAEIPQISDEEESQANIMRMPDKEDEEAHPSYGFTNKKVKSSTKAPTIWQVKIESEAESELKELDKKVRTSFQDIFRPTLTLKEFSKIKGKWIAMEGSAKKTIFVAEITPKDPHRAVCNVDKGEGKVSVVCFTERMDECTNCSYEELENITCSKVKATWKIVNKEDTKLTQDLKKEVQEECENKLFPELEKGPNVGSYPWNPLKEKRTKRTFHCHLDTKPPTYVAIWKADEKTKCIFMEAIGTHESVLKAKK